MLIVISILGGGKVLSISMQQLVILKWTRLLSFGISVELCNTLCPRSSDPFYIVSYYIKWVTTSWTHSMRHMPPFIVIYASVIWAEFVYFLSYLQTIYVIRYINKYDKKAMILFNQTLEFIAKDCQVKKFSCQRLSFFLQQQ